MTYSLEKHYEIWDDTSGEKISIGPDRDGSDLIEIRNDLENQALTFTVDQLVLLLKVLLEIIPQDKIIE